jgi:hypothetical protein
MLEKKVPRMSYTDLKDATNNFSENNVIGQGKIGMLYKAALPNAWLSLCSEEITQLSNPRGGIRVRIEDTWFIEACQLTSTFWIFNHIKTLASGLQIHAKW